MKKRKQLKLYKKQVNDLLAFYKERITKIKGRVFLYSIFLTLTGL